MTHDLGFKNIPVRFFLIRMDDEDGEIDTHEVDEQEFLNAEGVIEYERFTVFANGVSQICLTKNPFGKG